MRLVPLLSSLLSLSACPGGGTDKPEDSVVEGADLDGDGYTADLDCDDDDGEVNPGATETCDGVDNDCDGLTDGEDDDLEGDEVYTDVDGDGFGGDAEPIEGCADGVNYVLEAGDCDDYDPGVHPGADDPCDGVDQDCDGEADEDVELSTWYPDVDGDGFGADEGSVESCELPNGYASEGGDCDDGDSDVYPGASDLDDGEDNDCDGSIDEDGGGGEDYFLSGRYLTGHYSDGDWTCLNYYSATGYTYSDEALCEYCDYSLLIYAEYEEGATSYEDCDLDDFEFWRATTSFYSLWGFAYAPSGYSYPVVYYYYELGGYWLPNSPLFVGVSYYGYDLTQWYFFYVRYAPDQYEVGVFTMYPYID